MASGALVGLGLVLGLGGGGAIGYAVTRPAGGGMTPAGSAAMGAAIAQLDGDLKSAQAQVEGKAKTLAEISELRSSIGTDAATTMERIGKEIAFKPDTNEVLELAQAPKEGAPSSAPQTLVVLPATTDLASLTHAGKPGSYVELADGKAVITTVVRVTPSDKVASTTFDGFMTVSRLLPLQPAVDKLVAAGVAGRLELGGKTLAIGTPAAGAIDKAMPLPTLAGANLVVAVPKVAAGMSMPLVGAGAGGAGLGLILVVVGLLSGRRKTGLAPTGQALAPTMTSEGYPAGASAAATPAPGYVPTGVSATSPALSIAGSLAGQQIGRWQIIRILGSGGMADVFLAHARGEAGFEKQVALKVMHSHLARNERAVAHFLDEARLAARVQHPNVVQIHDLGKIGEDYVIVMDYVDGVDLERLLASARAGSRPVPIDVALGIMCRICDGLHAAHTAIAPDGTKLGIIHRDVKSANVLVSKQGAVKVVDFGIAKAATQVHHTVAGETKGTPSMMAPEQRIGEAVDVRVDVYAVAAVAYEILTGHGVNLDLAALAHLGIENWPHLPIPSSLRPELPHELDAILLGAMSYERDKRPANCETFEATFLAVMKTHHLSCSDKDIMRWVEGEIALLGAAESARLAVAT